VACSQPKKRHRIERVRESPVLKGVFPMLISFSVENYRSFADEQTLSMEAVKDDAHPDHVVDCGRFSLLKTAAIYGANASGKSNLLKAFGFMADFVQTSATEMTLGDPIRGAECFRLDKTRSGAPCSFDVRILLNGTEYQYGFSATKERVYDEWLYTTREGIRATNPLSRSFDPSTGKTDWKLRGELKSAKDVAARTRDNGLFISRAAEMNVEVVKEPFLWFREFYRYLDFSEVLAWFQALKETARRIENDETLRARVENLVSNADFGISGLLTTTSFSLPGGKPWYLIQTVHKPPGSEETINFSLEEDESNGTQRFVGIVGPILDALDKGSLLVVDELDCSMHPHLTYKLVEMFQSAEANPKGAQLVFATHDTNLMTPALFRRDEFWLPETAANGGTELCSLSDIESEKRPRKEEPFEKHYLAGRYGGVPSFGPSLEDIGTP